MNLRNSPFIRVVSVSHFVLLITFVCATSCPSVFPVWYFSFMSRWIEELSAALGLSHNITPLFVSSFVSLCPHAAN